MSQEYYVIENKKKLGGLHVGLQVVEVIVEETMKKIEEVTLENTGGISLKSKSPIEITINEKNQLSIEIDITVNYGVNVGNICNTIQNKIATAVSEMLDIKHILINIQVLGINF